MLVKSLGANIIQVTHKCNVILFSYNTPVAAFISEESKWIRTNKKWSATTTKHINKWLGPCKENSEEVTQDYMDSLAW